MFMVHVWQADGRFTPLPQPCIDVGVERERNLMVLQGVGFVFETDVFAWIVQEIRSPASARNTFKVFRSS